MSMTIDMPEAVSAPWETPASETKSEPEGQATEEATEIHSVKAEPETTAVAEGEPTDVIIEPQADEAEQGERQLLDQIFEAETQARKAAASKAEAERALADASAWLSAAAKSRDELLEKLPSKLIAMRGGEYGEERGAVEKVTSVYQEETQGNVDWRAYPTSELIAKGIAGLGDKKAETLIDAYPTLGKLEDARGEASRNNKHFSSVLPKGIGKSIADELEELMLTAVTKLQSSGSFQPSSPAPSTLAVHAEADEPAAADAEADDMESILFGNSEAKIEPESAAIEPSDNDLDPEPTEVGSETEAEEPVDEPSVAEITSTTDSLDARVEDLRSSDSKDLRAQHSRDIWRAGYDSAIDDLPVESCPYGSRGDEQDDWIRGWLAGIAISTDEL